jgi:hypothetical protein
MILTQCAVCATDLGLSLGKKCGRCSTRYCGAECQVQHWKEGGHDTLCKKIKRAGGAEQSYANNKYTEAVTVAVEKCADDTKGQTCYICTQALHWKTKEGLVRGCACRGTAGFAHVSCLAEEAKILFQEAEENNKTKDSALARWEKCSLCEQSYHGVVKCAFGWACWKTYVGRPEADQARASAMTLLGNGLSNADDHATALSVYEAELSTRRRVGASEQNILAVQSNLANSYHALGRSVDALRVRRDVYSGFVRILGKEHKATLTTAICYASTFIDLKRYAEAKALVRKWIPVARRVLGDDDENTLRLRWYYAGALWRDPCATFDDFRVAVNTLEDAERIARRVLGGAHPLTTGIERQLGLARAALHISEAPPGSA